MDTEKESLQWIFIVKGIGIILVVVGHFYPENSPIYWGEMRKGIYSFHMPLFFILSGFLFKHGKSSYSGFLKNKMKRLVYPFIAASIRAAKSFTASRVWQPIMLGDNRQIPKQTTI